MAHAKGDGAAILAGCLILIFGIWCTASPFLAMAGAIPDSAMWATFAVAGCFVVFGIIANVWGELVPEGRSAESADYIERPRFLFKRPPSSSAKALKELSYLKAAKNAFGHQIEGPNWRTYPFDKAHAADVLAIDDAIRISASWVQHTRGFTFKNARDEYQPPELTPHGYLIQTIDHPDGARDLVVASDVKLVPTNAAWRKPEVRMGVQPSIQAIAVVSEAEAGEATRLGLPRWSPNWANCLALVAAGDRWVRPAADDLRIGRIPILRLELKTVRVGQPRTDTPGFYWPDGNEGIVRARSPVELWLDQLADQLRFNVEQAAEARLPPFEIYWTTSDFRGEPNVLGRCYAPTVNTPTRIFLNPDNNPTAWQAAITLLHELIHAALPNAGHGPRFVEAAASLGFVAPFKQGVAPRFSGDWLKTELAGLPPMPLGLSARGTAKRPSADRTWYENDPFKR